MKFTLIIAHFLLGKWIVANELPLKIIDSSITTQVATISGSFSNNLKEDSVYLFLYGEEFFSEPEANSMLVPPTVIALKITKYKFSFSFPVSKKPTYVSIRFGPRYYSQNLIDYYLIEAGDCVKLEISNNQMEFAGKGSAKFRCKYLLDKQYDSLSTIINPYYVPGSDKLNSLNAFYRFYNSLVAIQLSQLNSYKERLNRPVYEIMTADIVGKFQEIVSSSVLKTITLFKDIKPNDTTAMKYLNALQNNYTKHLTYISESNLAFSRYYVSSLLENCKLTKYTGQISVYEQIKTFYAGQLRDKLAARYLIEYYDFLSNVNDMVSDAIFWINDKVLRELVINKHEAQKVGALAYNFSLFDKNDQIVRMSDFKGKIVFMDFWYIGCGACISYNKNTVAKVENIYRDNKNVVFLSISMEGKKENWLLAVNDGKYTSPDALNLYTGPLEFKHPVTKYYDISSAPRPILIDTDGRILSTNTRELGSVEKVAKKIDDALKHQN